MSASVVKVRHPANDQPFVADEQAKRERDVLREMKEELQASPFRIWTAEEIWAPLPEQVYIVDGFLLRANLALIVAFGSSLKTWTMADLCIAVPTGGMWLGRFACAQGRVLFVDWESGDYELRRRFQRVARARGIDGPIEGVEMITMPSIYFNSPDFEMHMMELAKGRSLIVFDSLAAGTVDVDENDARFAQGLQILKRVAALSGCAIVVLHHSLLSDNCTSPWTTITSPHP